MTDTDVMEADLNLERLVLDDASAAEEMATTRASIDHRNRAETGREQLITGEFGLGGHEQQSQDMPSHTCLAVRKLNQETQRD
ncbi:hypothetical protein Aduo_009222 [Ancylostoma duodenale]